MIEVEANGKPIIFKTTIFPDGTSQVFPHSYFPDKSFTYYSIRFLWENNEAEVIHLMQLIDFIHGVNPNAYINLYMPYLPYARQDKVWIGDTFSLKTFAAMLNAMHVSLVESFDVHSERATDLIRNFHSISPEMFHHDAIIKFRPDIIFYPDLGARNRYNRLNLPNISAVKARDPRTGVVTSYSIFNDDKHNLVDKRILIIDDICDGGNTFTKAAEALHRESVGEIGLCVSHGIFSKGKEVLTNAGITQIYTTNSIIKNEDGYKV